MTQHQDRMLRRIRALLAHAEDEHLDQKARESYNEKASLLIAQYGIDQALLAESGRVSDKITQLSLSIDNPYSHDKADLLSYIAHGMRCRTVRYPRGRTIVRVVVVGYQTDLDRVELLYTSLLLQSTSQMTRVRPAGHVSTAVYRRSWLLGFRTAVLKRLLASEKTASTQADQQCPSGSTSTALVLRSREDRVDIAFKDAFPGLRNTKRHSSIVGSGFSHGLAAGQRADLDDKRLANRARFITRD
ncbi:DUF2786 domain-containing protein [Allokutzneria sp. NRRL B-24872]|uniref:DUF2786 domain-containing protein n=1 Tax=Allokutzneria sp. NRRL B-24872 TaxID=1137961 RepID=UPI000A371B49|nr:DUF2786 domain-containing protein [Allokutzneria sp. NRRL B-24872]